MTELSDPRVPGGGAGKQVTLGGTTTSSGEPAGSVVVADVTASGSSLFVTDEHQGESNQSVIAAATGSLFVVGDLSVYGLPYTNLTFTKTGANAIATVTWSVTSSGLFVFDIAMNAADSILITADNMNGDTFSNPIAHIDAAGTASNAAITGAATFSGALYTFGS